MEKRFVSIWFRYFITDWFSLSKPDLKKIPFVTRSPFHGKMMIVAANRQAELNGITPGMALADASAIVSDLEVVDERPDSIGKVLVKLAEWCIRFTPIVAIDPPDSLIIDATGCSHLWGGDESYINEIVKRLSHRGYTVRAAMADTVGAAWAVARFGKGEMVVKSENHINSLMTLPPESLRLEKETVERLHKLGLHQVRQFINMPRSSLRRRFGQHFMMRLDMAIGQEIEIIEPVYPPEIYQERLPCMDPIVTATGIGIALQNLLETMCLRLQQEQMGIRMASFKGYRIDGKIEKIEIVTNRPSYNVKHLFKLFELKISTIEPSLGIELFVLDASKVEDHLPQQEKMWEGSDGLEDIRLSELIDRLGSQIGMQSIHRYLPSEHYWPERSFKPAISLQEKATTAWRSDKLRPLQLLSLPEKIEVAAPIPDYPPMLFIYKGKVHTIMKADGPERIEQEWWLQQGQHRDYYRVEDDEGHRYWLFRLGHYDEKVYQWFIHGFFS